MNFSANAAEITVAPISAKTGILPLESSEDYSYSLPETYENLPSKYSSKDLGFTLPVRQQHANTCWAFGTLSTFETLLLASGENAQHLAPEHTNYWGAVRPDGTGWQRETSSGGYSYIPLGYLTSWAGPINEADFPEEVSTQEDYNNFTTRPTYGLTEAVYFNKDADRNSIKSLIYNYGAVVGSFNADIDNYLSSNNCFYCADESLTPAELVGHCISVVGWDDDFPKENFSESKSGTPNNNGAWLIKNSWSEYAGDKGYYWISYEDVWLYDKIFGPSYALTSYEKLNDGIKMYQNEIDGATYEFSYFTYTNRVFSNITYMNAFTFTETDRNLDKVIFESTAVGADYTIYYIPFGKNNPTTDVDFWDKLFEGTVTHSGYICADIEDVELPVGKGCIGVLISNERANTEAEKTLVKNSIGCGEWLTSGNRYIFLPQSKKGMSYYMDMDRSRLEVKDVMDFYSTQYDDTVGGTFVIKAITNNYYTPSEPSTTPTTAPAPTTSVPIPSSTVTTPTESTPKDEVFTYKLGDGNQDGKVNVKDATHIQKATAAIINLNDYEKIASDVNGDGKVNVTDSTVIQKHGAKIDVKFDVDSEFTVTIVR